jgi:hypothetical protein
MRRHFASGCIIEQRQLLAAFVGRCGLHESACRVAWWCLRRPSRLVLSEACLDERPSIANELEAL